MAVAASVTAIFHLASKLERSLNFACNAASELHYNPAALEDSTVKAAICTLLVFTAVALAADRNQDAKSFLNKRVIVNNSTFLIAIEKDGKYEALGAISWMPPTYIGKPATVIAVYDRQPQPSGKVNALGEAIANNAETQFDFVVKFDNGFVAIKTDTFGGMQSDVLMPEQVEALAAKQKESEKKTQELIGKPVYGTHLSRVYRVDASLSEMNDKNVISFPILEPLMVEAAKWDTGSGCAIVRLKFPDGTGGLAFAVYDELQRCSQHPLMPSLPSVSKAELENIRSGNIVRGMSESSVWDIVGFPEKENDYGRAGRQLVYPNGLLVYINTDGNVEDVQHVNF